VLGLSRGDRAAAAARGEAVHAAFAEGARWEGADDVGVTTATSTGAARRASPFHVTLRVQGRRFVVQAEELRDLVLSVHDGIVESLDEPTVDIVWAQFWSHADSVAGDVLRGEAPQGLAFMVVPMSRASLFVLRGDDVDELRIWLDALPL